MEKGASDTGKRLRAVWRNCLFGIFSDWESRDGINMTIYPSGGVYLGKGSYFSKCLLPY